MHYYFQVCQQLTRNAYTYAYKFISSVVFTQVLSILQQMLNLVPGPKLTVILFPLDNNQPVRQYQLPALSKRTLRIVAGTFLCISFALIAHSLYLSSYIKVHQTEFANVDQLQAELSRKDIQIASLNSSISTVTASDTDDIKDFERKSYTQLQSQRVANTMLSRGSDSSERNLAQINGENNLTIEQHLQLLQEIYNSAVKTDELLSHYPSILPLQGSYSMSSPYGYRSNPFGGWSSEFHDGVDYSCAYGTPVHAVADGTVTFAGWDYGYGWKVMISHGNGITTFYGHNSRMTVKVGSQVKKGETISYSGNSGRSSGPHLHYGAYVNGQSVNPANLTK